MLNEFNFTALVHNNYITTSLAVTDFFGVNILISQHYLRKRIPGRTSIFQ